MKLDALARARDEQGFAIPMPPSGERQWQSGVVSAFANIVRLRCEQLGVFDHLDQHATPMLNALFSEEGAEGRTARHNELDGRYFQREHRR